LSPHLISIKAHVVRSAELGAMLPPCAKLSSAVAAGHDECDWPIGHEIDLSLCLDLERLADGLPALPCDYDLRQLSDRLHHASERWSDPASARLVAGSAVAAEARIADSIHAEDVVEAIWRHWRKPSTASTGQLSYMLRALFDGRRRAVALEQLWLGCVDCQSSARD